MIQLNKKYRTRSGKDVTIYTTEHTDEDFPIVGSVVDDIDTFAWSIDGWYSYKGTLNYGKSQYDLIEVNSYQEILAEAKRRYKVGDVVKCFLSGKDETIASFFTNLMEHSFEDQNQLYIGSIEEPCTGLMIYNNGTWAEIVQPEEDSFHGLADKIKENIDTLNFKQLSVVATMCMDRMMELNKQNK
jgi:hypothetical protein